MSKLVKTFTAEELAELKAYDKMVDKGEDLYPLSAKQKKNAKAVTTTSTGVYTFTKRERKPNEDKRELIDALDEAMVNVADNVIVINPERELEVWYNDVKYKIVLSAPRKQQMAGLPNPAIGPGRTGKNFHKKFL